MTEETNKPITDRDIAGVRLGRTSCFQPTLHLRLLNKTVQARFTTTPDELAVVKVPALQQLWVDAFSTDAEWRDVPVEEE